MEADDRSTGWRWTLALGALALAVRLLVVGVTLLRAPATVERLAALHDGREHQRLASELVEPAGRSALPPAARRFAPGYPLLVRLAAAGLPMPWAALSVAIAGAVLAAALLHRLGVAPAAVALFAVLTPSWIAFTATAMSEGPFVALALAGLLAWRRVEAVERPPTAGGGPSAGEPTGPPSRSSAALLAGLVFGLATLVRPVGAVLFAVLWLSRLRRRTRGARLPAAAAGFALPLAIWMAAAGIGRGRPPAQLAIYLRRDAAPPLASLLTGLLHPSADPLKWCQVVVVLALVAAAAWGLGGESQSAVRRDWRVWLGSQTLFYLLLPSVWVFECLPRFLVPCLPAVAAAIGARLPAPGPRRWLLAGLAWGVLTVGGVGTAVWWNLGALGAR